MVRKAPTPIPRTLQRREKLLQLINPRHKLRSLLVVISPVGPAASHLVLMVLFSLTTRPSIVLESRMDKHGAWFWYIIFLVSRVQGRLCCKVLPLADCPRDLCYGLCFVWQFNRMVPYALLVYLDIFSQLFSRHYVLITVIFSKPCLFWWSLSNWLLSIILAKLLSFIIAVCSLQAIKLWWLWTQIHPAEHG